MSEQLYSIKESTLIDIANALRRKNGETKSVYVLDESIDTIVSKSKDATGFESLNGYTTGASYDVVEFPNAKSIKLNIAYQMTDDRYDYILIARGKFDSTNFPRDNVERYAHNAYHNIEVIIEDTNAITIGFFRERESTNKGYYAECHGLDVDGNQIGGAMVWKDVNNTYQSSEMAQGIDDIVIGETLPEEAYSITGDCSYRFAHNGWNWFLDLLKDRMTTKDISNGSYMFYSCKYKTYPFDLNFVSGGCNTNMMLALTGFEEIPDIDFNQTNTYKDVSATFQATEAKSIGTLKNIYPSNFSSFFKNSYYLRYMPKFENLNLNRIRTYSSAGCGNIFENCHSLREIPEDFLKEIYGIWTSSYSSHLSSMFYYCYALDEIRGVNPKTGKMSSNMFAYTFGSCERVKDIIFATQEDGTPYSVDWKGQTINLINRVGYSAYNSTADKTAMCCLKNSGITKDKEVLDDASYQALKNDKDWFTVDIGYCRYNHDSAVNTINSLPDTSAYLATAGGTNTINFRGTAGAKTDGGAINTLTAEEIAVATAKGWTVTLS